MFSADTTINEILQIPEFSSFAPILLSNCHIPDRRWSLREMNGHFYDWVAESIAFGLNRLYGLAADGIRVDYDIYSEEERLADPEKAGTKLFFLPGEAGKPFVMICPGGGYASVCTLKEGLPVAAHLNEMGYNAFVLSYRVRSLSGRDGSALLPGPVEDFARALRLILSRRDEFKVSGERYAAAGFSSGGHLAGVWGMKELGAESYGLPKPEAIFLGYAAIDPSLYPEFHGHNILSSGMFGEAYTREDEDRYNVNLHIDAAYPPVYVWQCADDEIIPAETSLRMHRKLTEQKIPHIYREFRHGGHGFGAGEYTEARHWLTEAVSFWENIHCAAAGEMV